MPTVRPASREEPFRVAACGAAGGIVVRAGADSSPRVLVVHRSDGAWAFAHSGRRRGEAMVTAALRAVRAQTGFLCVPEAILGSTEHADRWNRTQLVRYWAMRPLSGAFAPTDNVDDCAWLRPAEAAVRLTNDHDRRLLLHAIPDIEAVLESRLRLLEGSLG